MLLNRKAFLFAVFCVVACSSVNLRLANAAADDVSRGLLIQGEGFLAQGDRGKAMDAFEKAIAADPKNARAYYRRASVLRRNGDVDKAAADLQLALELDPKEAFEFFDSGWALDKKKMIDEAIGSLSDQIKGEPKNIDLYFRRGFLNLVGGHAVKAIADCDEILLLDPNNLYALENRGCAYVEMGDFAKAAADGTEALRVAKLPSADIYANRAWAYVELGQFDKAMADIAEALRLAPESGDAYATRGYVYEKKGDHAKARADFARAAKLEANNRRDGLVRALYSMARPAAEEILVLPIQPFFMDRESRQHFHISREQERKLRSIAQKYNSDVQQWFAKAASQSSKLTEPQRQEAFQRYNVELIMACRNQVEELLKPEQSAAYKKCVLDLHAVSVVNYPGTYKELGLTSNQTAQLKRLDKEQAAYFEASWSKLQDDLFTILSGKQVDGIRAEFARQKAEIAKFSTQAHAFFSGTLTFTTGSASSQSEIQPAPETIFGQLPEHYSQLSMVGKKNHLGLTPTQQKELLEIAKAFQAEDSKLQKAEPSSGYTEAYWKALDALKAEVTHRIDGVLTPAQVENLKELSLNQQIFSAFKFKDGLLQEKIDWTDAQEAAWKKMLQDFKDNEFERHHSTYEKLMAILTDEQKEKFRESLKKNGR
jgi:tetratricopeptide (TPR) repeat protein